MERQQKPNSEYSNALENLWLDSLQVARVPKLIVPAALH